jgi:hypothetical protein
LNDFSFWYARYPRGITKGDGKKKPVLPTPPLPGAGEKWSGFCLRGVTASLNGPARYLAMAGEFEVEWPTLESVPLELKKGEIEDIALLSDPAFRDG